MRHRAADLDQPDARLSVAAFGHKRTALLVNASLAIASDEAVVGKNGSAAVGKMLRPLRVDGGLKGSACERRKGDAHDHLARTTVGSMQRIFRTRSLCLRRQDCRRQSYK